MAYIKDTPNTRTAGEWLAQDLDPDDMVPAGGILDISQFLAQDAVSVVVGSGASQNATSVTITALVDPLPLPIATYTVPARVLIPSGTVLYFGGQKVAQLTADAVAGDTTLTVAALPTALVTGDTATYAGSGKYPKAVASGILIGRTYAERDNNTPFGAAALTDDEIYFVAFDKQDLVKDATVDLVKMSKGLSVYENRLPQYSSFNTAINEVQTVTVSGSLSGGVVILGDGKGKTTSIAYNANLAAVQAGYDALYGSSKVVVAGTLASHTVTFSGTGFAGVGQTLITVDGSNATGFTGATVARTTQGGKPWLEFIRAKCNSITGYN